jgi:hypothetical protein
MLVRNNTSKFGENAGKVWKVISDHGKESFDRIKSETHLSDSDVYIAIGWLARENKIKKDNDMYSIDETNLEQHIGDTAGKIYKILNIWERADFPTLKKLCNQNNEDIFSALGWLAREDKIQMNQDMKYMLKFN